MFSKQEIARTERCIEYAEEVSHERECDYRHAVATEEERRAVLAYGKLLECDGDVQEAISETCYRHPEIAAAFRNGDETTLGRLIRQRASEYLWRVATKI